MAISYKDLKCTQLGAINNLMACNSPQNTVQEKTTVNCPGFLWDNYYFHSRAQAIWAQLLLLTYWKISIVIFPVRVDPKANFGNDPCITASSTASLSFNKNGICPRNSAKYVVRLVACILPYHVIENIYRGIDELGNRVTLDNDYMNVSI